MLLLTDLFMNVVYQLTATALLSMFYMWSDFAAKMPKSLLPVLLYKLACEVFYHVLVFQIFL